MSHRTGYRRLWHGHCKYNQQRGPKPVPEGEVRRSGIQRKHGFGNCGMRNRTPGHRIIKTRRSSTQASDRTPGLKTRAIFLVHPSAKTSPPGSESRGSRELSVELVRSSSVTTAIDFVTRPASRTFRYVASINRYGQSPFPGRWRCYAYVLRTFLPQMAESAINHSGRIKSGLRNFLHYPSAERSLHGSRM
jgi:hypothetical protein